jgi:hypothetical protein
MELAAATDQRLARFFGGFLLYPFWQQSPTWVARRQAPGGSSGGEAKNTDSTGAER